MKDVVTIRGVPTIELYDEDGNLKQSLTDNNLIVQSGKNYFARKIINETGGDTSDITVFSAGNGTSPASVSDSTLESQTGVTNISDYFVNGNEITFFGGFIQGAATGTVSELGVLTDNSTLISRIVLSDPFEKAESDFLNVNWKIQIG